MSSELKIPTCPLWATMCSPVYLVLTLQRMATVARALAPKLELSGEHLYELMFQVQPTLEEKFLDDFMREKGLWDEFEIWKKELCANAKRVD